MPSVDKAGNKNPRMSSFVPACDRKSNYGVGMGSDREMRGKESAEEARSVLEL
jgi:hypothetical protein